MKIIITETQEEKIHVLRRIASDWIWIIEIVDEGSDLFDPINFNNVDDYVIKVANDSAETYLLNYIDDWKSGTFLLLKIYLSSLIEEKLYDRISRYYNSIMQRNWNPPD